MIQAGRSHRYGIVVPNVGQFADADTIIAVAKRAESLGFDSVWAIDHIVVPRSSFGEFGATAYEQLVVLSVLAAATTNVRLGTTVLVLPYRNAVLMAKMIATLDVMSGGRLILGIGVGHVAAEFAALEVDYGRRGPATDEALATMKALWSGNARPPGKLRDRFRDVLFSPKPLQQPHPPILVGGVGRRAIDRAVRDGDGWHPTTFLSDEEIFAGAADLQRLWRAAGRSAKPEIALGVAVQWNPRPSRRSVTWGSVRVISGSSEQIAAQLTRLATCVTQFVLHIRARSRLDLLEQMDAVAAEVIPRVGSSAG